MKKYILILLLVVTGVVYGQSPNIEDVDAYTKTQLQTSGQAIVNPNNVTGVCDIVVESDSTNGDSLLTINNGVIGKIGNVTVTSEFATDTNTYFTGASMQGSTTTVGMANNTVRAWPIFVGNTMTIDKIKMYFFII